MEILRTKNDLRLWRREIVKHQRLGFAPTMGALHNGHLSLIQASKRDNEKTLISIFVNPAQFGVNEDFDKYPRDEHSDIELCRKSGVDALFLPSIAEMYKSSNEIDIIPPKNLATTFEGGLRSGHFNGVLRVVLKKGESKKLKNDRFVKSTQKSTKSQTLHKDSKSGFASLHDLSPQDEICKNQKAKND